MYVIDKASGQQQVVEFRGSRVTRGFSTVCGGVGAPTPAFFKGQWYSALGLRDTQCETKRGRLDTGGSDHTKVLL